MATVGWAGVAIVAACEPTPTGDLSVLSNNSVAFHSSTGFGQSFFSSDNALGPAQDISFDSSRLIVRYSDNFSTLDSQEEVVVFARDPNEYQHTLESIVGPDPTINGIDPGNYLEWARQTFAPGDVWPMVPDPGTPITFPPNGVELPLAVSFPYPNAITPQTDWSMSKALFSGATNVDFVGAANSFGGSIKGLSVMRHGVCSFEQSIGGSLSTLASSIPLHGNVFVASYDISDLGVASFVSYAPGGGLVLSGQIDGQEVMLPPLPPIPTSFSIQANYTYTYGLDDGIFSVNASSNTYDFSEVSGIAAGQFHGVLEKTIPDNVKLSALEGAKGTFKGGQAQPIPVILAGAMDPKCSDTSGPRPSSCFTLCASTDTVDMTNPSTWPAAEDLGDPTTIDPPSWHDASFCSFPAAALGGAVSSAASTYPGMTANGPSILSSAVVEPLDGDATKLHNFRCNFHPRYEAGTFASIDPLTTGHPFNVGEKSIMTGPPVCEVIVRLKRVNVFPDTVEAVFFDGPSLQQVDPSDFANEAFGLFLGLGAFAPSAQSSMCARTAETTLMERPCAHTLLH